MLYGEHIGAEEVTVWCRCGIAAVDEVLDGRGQSCGWHCRRCARQKRRELRLLEKLARSIVRKGFP